MMIETSENGRRAKADKGFSLIELLIVIAILGILAVVVVLSVGGTTTSAKSKACTADKKTLQIAAEAYNASTGGYPLTDAVLLGTPAVAANPNANPPTPSVPATPAYLQSADLSYSVAGPAASTSKLDIIPIPNNSNNCK